MAVPKVTERDVDALLASGALVVCGNHVWKQKSQKSWISTEIGVSVAVGANTHPRSKLPKLSILATVNRLMISKFSVVLLWNKIRVRGLCVGGCHENHHTDQGKWMHQTHKHKWTDLCQDRFAYTPNDITASSVPDVVKQFCKECGIDFAATLADVPPFQADGGLLNDL